MAWAFVQSRSARVGSGAHALAYTTPNGAGHLLIAAVAIESASATITTFTDSAGNLWTPIGSLIATASFEGQLYYAKNCLAGANTVMMTPSSGASTLHLFEFSGLDLSTPYEVQAAAQASSGTTADSGPLTTTQANELLFGFCVSNRVLTIGSGFTVGESTVFNFYEVSEYTTATPAGSFSAFETLASSGSWICLGVAFRIPSAAATTSVTTEVQFYLDPPSYAEAVLADGATLYQRLGELSGAVAEDSSGHSYDGAIAGGVTLGQPGALADGDTAMRFDGATGYVQHHASLPATGTTCTIAFWLKADSTQSSAYGTILSDVIGNDGIYYLPATRKLTIYRAGDHLSTTVLTDGVWYFVVVVVVAGTVTLYVNAVADGLTFAGFLSYVPLWTGSYPGPLNMLKGTLDEFAIAPTVLTPTQIAHYYALRTTPATGWFDMLDDVRGQAPLVCEYGIQGSTPTDRVASTGRLEFALNNSVRNSGGILGYYSPLHSDKRAGFDFNIPVRYKLTSGGQVAYKFRGSLADILPTAGIADERLVACVALDWMDDAARFDLPDLPAQITKRPDELITTILDALPVADQPVARDIETGSETYGVALDGGATGSRPKVREVLNQIALSELGKIYLKGDPLTGGVFTFTNRQHPSLNQTLLVTLTDAEIDRAGIVVPGSRDEIYSTVQVFVKPTRIDASATTVLHALQTTTTLVQPGETNDTIFGPYRDPVNNDQIGGTATVDPAATTDYLMNTLADGTGSDLTASFLVTASRTGLGVRYTITNTGATPGYVTKLQVRGKGIYRYEAMIEVATPTAFGNRVFAYDMAYQNNTNVGADVANYLASVLATPFAHVQSVRFLANKSAALMQAAIVGEPGDRIALSEIVTGVDGLFTINSVRLEQPIGSLLWCTWGLEPASATKFWFLGMAGASELGETTVLGF